ncbi:MAG: hypothetical protein JWP94_1356 [Mucilaginibacter sp.]|nr:hypothetical protein [Mucilaginibacter sp.]
MKPKRIVLAALLISISFICKSQTLSRINIEVGNTFVKIRSIDVAYGNNIYCLNLHGRIINSSDSADNLNIVFYDEFDGQQNIGKLKSTGNVTFTYYTVFDGPNDIGKLKSIGNSPITYYTVYDGFDNIGKLKSIGNTRITYYDRFDISDTTGKIKSIDGDNPYLYILQM